MSTLQAFAAQAALVEDTIGRIAEGQWTQPALGVWDVAALVAHLVRAASLPAEYLSRPVEGDTPAHDRITYFTQDIRGAAHAVADRSIEDASRIGTGQLPAAFADGWRRSVRSIEDLPPTRLATVFGGSMFIAEYLGTRVLELVVHHEDLGRALGTDVTHDALAMSMTVQILSTLTTTSPSDLAMDDVSFVMAATGRTAHDDPRLPAFT